MMKSVISKITTSFALVLIGLGMQSCYDEYKNDFDYDAVYFSRQYPLRTLVDQPQSILSFNLGVVLAGKYSKDANESVQYMIDESMLAEYPDLKLLPSDYYTLSDEEQFTIHKGESIGEVEVNLDREKFTADPDAVNGVYALPIRLFNASTDSILSEKDFTIYVVKYINQYEGWYYVTGKDTNLESGHEEIYHKVDIIDNRDAWLKTMSINKLNVPYVGMNQDGDKYAMQITIDEDTSVAISSLEGSDMPVSTGSGVYDEKTRNITLQYTYTDKDGADHQVSDTLLYRNTELKFETWK